MSQFLSKQYVNELGQIYLPSGDYSVTPYNFTVNGSSTGNASSTHKWISPIGPNLRYLTGIWTSPATIITTTGSLITNNIDVNNCNDSVKQAFLSLNLDLGNIPPNYFRVVCPGFLVSETNVGVIYCIPTGARLFNPPLFTYFTGPYSRTVFAVTTNDQTYNLCTVVDPCIYVGYLATSSSGSVAASDFVGLSYVHNYYGNVLGGTNISRGVFRDQNIHYLTETTSDNILCFDYACISIPSGTNSKSLSFLGYKIQPNYSQNYLYQFSVITT